MTTPTSKAVPSSDPLDLLYNAEKLDEALNTGALTYADRFGVSRKTLAGAVATISIVNPRGAWTTATAYLARDLVSNSGTWYIALDNHTSGATFAGDQAAHWRVHQGLLAVDLADTSNTTLGDALMGVKHPSTGGAARTQHQKNQDWLTIQDFGGVGDGTTDDTTAITNALAAAAATQRQLLVAGRFRHTAQITVPARVRLAGISATSDSVSGSRSLSCFIKDFNGQGFLFSGDDAVADGLQFDSTAAKTGDNVQITGSRVTLRNCVATNAGQDGFRVGADSGSFNTNLWRLENCGAVACGRHGLYVHDPAGSADTNGGYCSNFDARVNGGDGINEGSTAWNTYVAPVCQVNAKLAIRISSASRGVTVIGGDLEGNGAGAFTATISGTTMTVSAVSSGSVQVGGLVTGVGVAVGTIVTALGTGTGGTGTYTVSKSQSVGPVSMTTTVQGLLEPGTLAHTIYSPYFGSVQAWVDLSGFPERNVLTHYDNNIDGLVARMVFGAWLTLHNRLAGGVAGFDFFAEHFNTASLQSKKTGTNGGEMRFKTKADAGGTPTDALLLDSGQNATLTGQLATSAAAPTIASANTIAPTKRIVFVSGTTLVKTITPPSPISAGGGQITLIPTGLWSTDTTGNIALATTAVVGKALTMTYDATTTKWYPSY